VGKSAPKSKSEKAKLFMLLLCTYFNNPVNTNRLPYNQLLAQKQQTVLTVDSKTPNPNYLK
jgi:hypothetical protein